MPVPEPATLQTRASSLWRISDSLADLLSAMLCSRMWFDNVDRHGDCGGFIVEISSLDSADIGIGVLGCMAVSAVMLYKYGIHHSLSLPYDLFDSNSEITRHAGTKAAHMLVFQSR